MDFRQHTYRDLLAEAHSFADQKDISSLNQIKQELISRINAKEGDLVTVFGQEWVITKFVL